MDGFLNLLKPPGMTSSDAVLMVRKLCPKGTRVGHGGTLDPDAAGVLPICVGRAARLFDYIIDKQKRYVAELRLGIETDTQDATGQIVRERPVDAGLDQLVSVLPHFTGQIMQIPPQFSAIKRGGQRAYDVARAGGKLNIEPRPVLVQNVSLIRQTGKDRYLLQVECGKGLYIRTLLHDIGQALGCGGHMAFLLRTHAGRFDIQTAHSVEEVLAAGEIAKLLTPMDWPLQHLPRIELDARCAHAVKNGNPIKPEWLVAPIDRPELPQRMYLSGLFCGMGEAQAGGVRFRAMLMTGEGAE